MLTIKNIYYKGKVFQIGYVSYLTKDTQNDKIDWQEHVVELLKIDNKDFNDLTVSWKDYCRPEHYTREEVIEKIKTLLDYYLNNSRQMVVTNKPFCGEFNDWDGNLDNWQKDEILFKIKRNYR